LGITSGFFNLYSLAACTSQAASLSPLVNSFDGFYEAAYKSKFPKRLKGTCLCITSGYREAACDAQKAKGKPRKQITSDFSEPFANYAVFSAMYIKKFSS
jgi:hypothetical protein